MPLSCSPGSQSNWDNISHHHIFICRYAPVPQSWIESYLDNSSHHHIFICRYAPVPQSWVESYLDDISHHHIFTCRYAPVSQSWVAVKLGCRVLQVSGRVWPGLHHHVWKVSGIVFPVQDNIMIRAPPLGVCPIVITLSVRPSVCQSKNFEPRPWDIKSWTR